MDTAFRSEEITQAGLAELLFYSQQSLDLPLAVTRIRKLVRDATDDALELEVKIEPHLSSLKDSINFKVKKETTHFNRGQNSGALLGIGQPFMVILILLPAVLVHLINFLLGIT